MWPQQRGVVLEGYNSTSREQRAAGQQGQGQKDDEPCWAGGLGTLGPGWRKSTSICALGGAAELEESMARLRGCAELIINTHALSSTRM